MTRRYSFLPRLLALVAVCCGLLVVNGWFIDSFRIRNGTALDKMFHLGFGLAFLVGLQAALTRQRLARLPLLVLTVGVLLGSCGLLPYPEQSLLTTPLPDWDLFCLGREGHRHWLFHSSLPALALLLVAWRSRNWRLLAIGVLVGVGSHLVADLLQVAPGNRIIRGFYRPYAIAWMLANAALATIAAYIASARHGSESVP